MGQLGRLGGLRRNAWRCVGLAAMALLAACSRSELGGCRETDSACVANAYSKHQVRKASFWAEELAKPRSARMGPAPDALLDFLALGNLVDGFKERPRSAVLDPAFKADVQAALDEIPSDVWKLAQSRLVGIYFVEQLGGTGLTDYVLGPNGQPTHAFVVLDAAVLGALQANAWATWKENTPFKLQPQSRDTLTATIANPEHNNRKSAIQYLLLHELAHVISVGRKVHPNWGVPAVRPATGQYRFFDLSWTVNNSQTAYVSAFDTAWPQRKDVVYYRGAKLLASDMASTYQALTKTNFPTLYAATVPGDDFAESLVNYVHTVRMGKPWRISIQRDADVVQTVEPCWAEERCAPKRKLLEAILAGS